MTTERDDIPQDDQIAPQVEGDEAQSAAEEEQPRPLSPRDEALEAIYAKRREELQAEAGETQAEAEGEGGTGTAGTEGEGGDPPTTLEPEPAPAGAVATEGASAQPAADEPMVDLVVNGVKVTITQSEAIRRAQIATAGGIAMQQLANERRAREAAEAEIARLRAGQQAAPSPQPGADADDDIDPKVIDALRYGTDEEMRDALRVVVRKARVPAEPSQQVDHAALIERAATKVRADITFDQAMERIGQDFPNVFGDTDLATLAAARVQALVADDATNGIHRPAYEVLREACQTVDAKFVRRDPAQADRRPTASAKPPTNGATVQIDGEGREGAKRRLVAGPAAPLARQAVPNPDNQAPPSEADIRRQGLEDIRKARGQSR